MSERVEASKKTLKEELQEIVSNLIDEGQYNENWTWTKEIVLEAINSKLEGLVAELQEILKSRPLQKENNDFGLDYWGCKKEVDEWFEQFEQKVLVKLGVEDLTLTNVETTKFSDGSALIRKDYSQKKETKA